MITIRPMEILDLPAVIDRFDYLMKQEIALGSTLIEGQDEPRRKGIMRALWAAEMQKPDSLVLVAEVDGAVHGFLMASIHQQFEFVKNPRTAYIFALQIDKTLPLGQRGSIFKKGFAVFQNWLHSMGATSYWGNVYHANEQARKVLRKLGMKAQYLRYEGAT